MSDRRRRLAVLSGAAPWYVRRVLGVSPASLVAYYPLNETAGTVAKNAQGLTARNGTYQGPTLANDLTGPFGTPAPRFDGINDDVLIYSASLQALAPGILNELTLACWIKVSAVGIWTDSAEHRILGIEDADNNRRVALVKKTNNNTLAGQRYDGSVFSEPGIAGETSTSWMHIAVTVSQSGNAMKIFKNGTQIGSTVTGLGTYAGTTLSATQTAIGSQSTTYWSGWVAHAVIYSAALAQPQIATLALA